MCHFLPPCNKFLAEHVKRVQITMRYFSKRKKNILLYYKSPEVLCLVVLYFLLPFPDHPSPLHVIFSVIKAHSQSSKMNNLPTLKEVLYPP